MKPDAHPQPDAAAVVVLHDRRRTPRLEVMGALHGQMVPMRVAIRVCEIGLGGFSIETVFPLPEEAVQEFRFTLRNGLTVNVRGRVKHCRPESRDGAVVYVIGLEYADDTPTQRTKATTLIHEVASTPRP
jgi:hypothetical protein